jgi:hypothetical protein
VPQGTRVVARQVTGSPATRGRRTTSVVPSWLRQRCGSKRSAPQRTSKSSSGPLAEGHAEKCYRETAPGRRRRLVAPPIVSRCSPAAVSRNATPGGGARALTSTASGRLRPRVSMANLPPQPRTHARARHQFGTAAIPSDRRRRDHTATCPARDPTHSCGFNARTASTPSAAARTGAAIPATAAGYGAVKPRSRLQRPRV